MNWSGGSVFTVQVRSLNTRTVRWRSLAAATHENHLTFTGALGATYQFRIQAGSGPFSTATTVVPSGTRVTHGRFTGPWRLVKRRGAWQQHAIQATSSGAALTLRYVGGALSVIGETTSRGGHAPRHPRRPLAHASPALRRLRRRRVIYTAAVAAGVHHLKLVDVRGLVALEGLAIASRTG